MKKIIQIGLYICSVLVFSMYLKLEYTVSFNFNYFYRLAFIVVSSLLMIIGSYISIKNNKSEVERKKLIKSTEIILFIYYIIFISNMVVFSRTVDYTSYNFIPFKTITSIITNNSSIYYKIINILGNTFVFMPLSYFIPKLFSKVNSLSSYTIVISIIIILIEVTQILLKCGTCDIDDFILNVGGCLICYLFLKKTNILKSN